MRQLTVSQLLSVVARAELTLSGVMFCEREPRTLLRDLAAVKALCQDIIGASHMGCAADTVILELGTCATCGQEHDVESQCPVAIGEREECGDCGAIGTHHCPAWCDVPHCNTEGKVSSCHQRTGR